MMAINQRKSTVSKKRNSEQKESTGIVKDLKNNNANQEGYSSIPWKKIFSRFLLSMLMIVAVYWTSKKDDYYVFANQKDKLQLTSAEVQCSSSFKKDISAFKDCIPNHCGRLVTDMVVTPEEAAHLLRLSKKGLALGGSSGGASILDLHSGALSHENSFINFYEKLKAHGKNKVLSQDDFRVYSNVRNKIQQLISFNFGIPVNKLYLTHPTFFSEMTAKLAKTKHDEYWHVHIDKETYPSFHYTSLLYLSDYGIDFSGGRFVFVSEGKNMTVEPRLGRVSAFTSGAENPHYVERVSSGARYALTVSFTCDPKFAISDPTMKNLE